MTKFFRTYQGLRQGDPMSPILFNLAVEVLATLMRKAVQQKKVKGLMTHLILEGISHVQYADDTILMIEGNDNLVINMKFILYCFEWISGLKINYHKSEAYLFGWEEEDKRRIVNMLNYELGELPMRYLGIPVSDSKLGKGAFRVMPEKMSKRILPWKSKHMSSGARMILSNSSLTNLLTFTMGFYLLPFGTHREMDNIRAKFFWKGVEDNFKYHMMKWDAVC
jgi:hypothetical protein